MNTLNDRLSHLDRQKTEHIKKIIRIITIFVLIALVIFLFIGYKKHWFSSEAPLADLFSRLGIAGYLVSCLLIIGNTLFPVIPGAIPSIATYMAYGPWIGFFTVLSMNILGSVFSFQLAKKYGKTFVLAFISYETYEKLIAKIEDERSATKLLILAFLIPGFPDDASVMICGLTKMRLSRMLLICLIAKPLPTIAFLFGSSSIIELLFRWIAG